ncbi:MAG: metallophosphoesterase [Solirubrobacterales bacterium]|nr:metallophosphoesterase [Solirubrobacterales bacterium]
MRNRLTLAPAILTTAALLTTPAAATERVTPPLSWPPAQASGELFAHIGEEHLTDEDGPRVLPAVVAEVGKYQPLALMASADKSDNGTPAKLEDYKATVITPLAAAGVPVYSATGNHDRTAPAPLPGGLPGTLDSSTYRSVFADQPFPWGDAPPVTRAPFAPQVRPANDPAGASNHYVVDIGAARWIFLDNSCYEITVCDRFQNPPFPDAEGFPGQFAWMTAKAKAAKAEGRKVFLVMHMPTQDDRPGHSEPTPGAHTMGEGTSPDNGTLERLAAEAGVDGVFAGHIKVMQQYRAGGVPYFIDGGAGGKLYKNEDEEVGTDSGYWYGYRLVRVTPEGVQTDAVPVVVPDGISVEAPAVLERGRSAELTASARSPATEGVRVDALELRDPDAAAARQDVDKLPNPARIWTTGDPLVLAPVASPTDDPRRDPATQTADGRFQARCPGLAPVTVTSGFASQRAFVKVPSRDGEIVRSLARRGSTIGRARRSTKLAALRLAQPARLIVRVMRGGKTLGDLERTCTPTRKPISIRWDGRLEGKRVTRGTYSVSVRVASDRPSTVRRYKVKVR